MCIPEWLTTHVYDDAQYKSECDLCVQLTSKSNFQGIILIPVIRVAVWKGSLDPDLDSEICVATPSGLQIKIYRMAIEQFPWRSYCAQ